MVVFEMITVIAVVGILSGVLMEWMKKRQTPPVDLTGIESRLDNLETLQKRVEVLEAIVTDKGYDLKAEIDNLG